MTYKVKVLTFISMIEIPVICLGCNKSYGALRVQFGGKGLAPSIIVGSARQCKSMRQVESVKLGEGTKQREVKQ